MKTFMSLAFLVIWGAANVGAQNTDCVWLNDPGCTEPWTSGSKDVWVTLPGTPPCSLLVRVYYEVRCLQIEIQDFAVSLIVTSPSGCATKAAISAFLSSSSFKNQVTQDVILQLTRDFYIRTGTRPPDCPSQTSSTVGRVNRCWQLSVVYSFPGGVTMSEPYDPFMPWSYYENLYSDGGGVPVEIGFTSCLSTACCYRSMSHCFDSNGNLVYTFGPWISTGTCPPFSPCTYLFCE